MTISSLLTRRRALIVLAVAVVALALIVTTMAVAVHDEAFQLDGDISDTDLNPGGPGTPTVDWENLFDVVGNNVPTVKGTLPVGFIQADFVRDFVPGASGPDRTTFATGSKDTLNITPGWQCARDNNVNDKTDLVNVYATAYTDPATGELKMYLALERFSNEGAGNVAFWILQDGTVACEAPASGPSTTSFTGDHEDGDVLVVSEFTNGGVVNSINAYEWVGGAGGALNMTPIASGVDCKSEGAGDDICATVNTSLFTPPWLTETKQPGNTPSNDLDVSEFFEAGISLSGLGFADRCFTKILADTRSSPSLTATIFDFALGELPLCNLAVTKDGDTLSKVGDDVDYTITIENTGGITLYKQSIVDTLLGDLTDGTNPLITSSDCGASLDAGASCTINVTRTVQVGDPDPLPNTVTVVYDSKSDLLGDEVTREDDHEVNLFQPSVEVSKDGFMLSKAGDDVNYTIIITNTSSADTPNFINGTIEDDVLGDLLDPANGYVTDSNCTDNLATGAKCVINATYTIQPDDDDPLVNTVEVHYNPDGFSNDITDNASHSVELFQPDVSIEKTGDELSKVGDGVDYTITVTNESSDDSPNLTCNISDPLLGVDKQDVNLAPGEDDVTNITYTVQPGDNDPLVNTASVACTVDGFGNPLTDEDSHTVNLFQPSVDVDKDGDMLSKIGDAVNYTIIITNTSSPDSPNLVNGTIVDSILGDLLDGDNPNIDSSNCFASLPTGGKCVISAVRTVLETDPDPLDNTVTVHYNPDGFPNDITDSDDHSVELFQPGITIDKTGDSLSKIGDDVSYTITVSNTSSADSPNLTCAVTDSLLALNENVNLAPGDKSIFNEDRTVQGDDPDPLVNTASVSCTVDGFGNVLTASDDHSVDLFGPSIAVDKTGDSLSKVGDEVNYTITLSNNSSPDTPALDCTANDSLLGTVFSGVLPPGDTVINPKRTVQEGDPDPLVNTVTLSCSPEGFPNMLDVSDSHSVNLFQPAIAVDKTGDDLSKVGDDVNYTITLSNNSSDDTPALNCTATDSLLGEVFNEVLPLGDTVLDLSRTVEEDDPDPLINSVSMTCSVAGFPNVLDAGPASHSTDLFQPAVEVIKTGPSSAFVGDTVTYNFTINNLSSADSPDLILDSVTDTVLGDLTTAADAAGCGTLVSPPDPASTCNFTFDYTIQAGDPNPLENVVTVLYHPDPFTNDITDDDDHSLEVLVMQEACTPGFWQGGAGSKLWNEVDDPDWTGEGTNPFIHTTLFNDYFNVETDERLDELTMFDLVSTGGTNNPARKAARDMVAAYLNESAFPDTFAADSLDQLKTMWYEAVASGDNALNDFHKLVSGWNDPGDLAYCPLP